MREMRTKNGFEFNTKDGFRGVSSKIWPRESEDAPRAKRLRFADVETDYAVKNKINDCSIGGQGPSRCADPKTSEYAFYRKLREDAGHNFHSYQLLKRGDKHRKSQANELNKVSEPNQEKFTSLFPLEISTPSELRCHSSFRASKKTGLDEPDEGPFSKKRRRLRQLAAASLNLDIAECEKGCDLVSVLLQRLVPVYDSSPSNSFVEREPRSRHTRTTTTNYTTKPQSTYIDDPSYLRSRCTFEEPPQFAGANASPFAVRYLKNISPHCLPNREIAFSQLKNVDYDSPLTGSHEKSLIQYGRKPENCIDFERAPCLHSNQGSVLGFHHPSTKFSFPGSGYFPLNTNLTPPRLVYSTCNNLIKHGEFPDTSMDSSSKSYETFNGLNYANEPDIRKGGCGYQVLDWDANRIKNEERSDFETPDMNLSWMIPFHQREAPAEPLRLSSKSALATWPCPDSRVRNFFLQSSPIDVVGTHQANENFCQLVQLDSFSSSPCNLNYFRTLEESSWLRGKYEWSSHCTPCRRYKCMNEALEEKVPSNADSLVLYSGHDLDFGWKSLPISNFTSEHSSFPSFSFQALIKDITMLSGDTTDANLASLSKSATEVRLAEEMLLSPLSFRVSLDEKRSWPLLLDRSEGAARQDGKEHWTDDF